MLLIVVAALVGSFTDLFGLSPTTALIIKGLSVLVVLVLSLITFVITNQRLLKPLHYLAQHFEAIASGDLTQSIVRKSNDEVGQVFAAMQRMQDSLVKSLGRVRINAAKISEGTEHIAQGNQSLNARIEEQAAALQQTATSMEQLAGTVRQNADNAHQANQLAATASNVAQRGGQAVGEVVSTMQGISASSSKISDIIGVIDSIAFQTNILALNAAVEAARAGEQGRGFAVVASEVRALAQRSAQAAREITDLIDDSVSKVTEGSSQVERAGATMQEIVDSVKRVTDIMGEISAATIEQSSGIDQINSAVSAMDSGTAHNAQMVAENSRSATDMNQQAVGLYQALAHYQLPGAYTIDVKAQQVAQKTAPQSPPSAALASKRAPAGLTHSATRPAKSTAAPIAARAALGSATATAKTKPADIPGMNVRSQTTNDEKLLRPDLSGNKSTSTEDDWVEF